MAVACPSCDEAVADVTEEDWACESCGESGWFVPYAHPEPSELCRDPYWVKKRER